MTTTTDNPFAAEDARWASVDNPNGEYTPRDVNAPKNRQINVIADDMSPTVAANVALYYRQKEEPWAIVMADRVRPAVAAAVGANDNRAVRKRRAA